MEFRSLKRSCIFNVEISSNIRNIIFVIKHIVYPLIVFLPVLLICHNFFFLSCVSFYFILNSIFPFPWKCCFFSLSCSVLFIPFGSYTPFVRFTCFLPSSYYVILPFGFLLLINNQHVYMHYYTFTQVYVHMRVRMHAQMLKDMFSNQCISIFFVSSCIPLNYM